MVESSLAQVEESEQAPPLGLEEDFDLVLSLLPDGWRDKARELGALRRARKVPSPEVLLRVLLIHLAEGCSLRETAVRARQAGLVDLSDVAILVRLRNAGEWLRWINAGLMAKWVGDEAPPEQTLAGRRLRVVDATRVKEPGPSGSTWCLHYAIGLPSLAADTCVLGDVHDNGESFTRFAVAKGDVMMGDRAYGVRPGIAHVVERGGDVLVRFVMSNLALLDEGGAPFDLLAHLRRLRGRKVGEWNVRLAGKGPAIAGRVCAIKKSRQATERAISEVRRQANKHGYATKPETIETAGYTFVFTTLGDEVLSASAVLELYRRRWQIELVFKRLKSIIGLSHLRKTDPDAAIAWLHGKLLVAFLVETLLRHAQSFSPWGYALEASGR